MWVHYFLTFLREASPLGEGIPGAESDARWSSSPPVMDDPYSFATIPDLHSPPTSKIYFQIIRIELRK